MNITASQITGNSTVQHPFVRGMHWWIPSKQANNVENVSIWLESAKSI